MSLIPEKLITLIEQSEGVDRIKPQYVLGGPCICFAKGNWERLTIQDLVDSIVPCIVGSHNETPVYLYFQSYESDLMHETLVFDPNDADYDLMKHALIRGIECILEKIGYPVPEINIIDTYCEDIKYGIDQYSDLLKKEISRSDLFGLYSEDPLKDYPKGSPEENLMIDVYYRNLALYYPDFLNRVTRGNGSYLIIENNTQQKALRLMQEYLDRYESNFLVYPTSKNRQNKEMCMGNRNHKVELRSTPRQVVERGNFAHLAEVDSFYKNIFNGISVVDVMMSWKSSVREVIESTA